MRALAMVAAPKITAAFGLATEPLKRTEPSEPDTTVVNAPLRITITPDAVVTAPRTGPAVPIFQRGFEKSLGSYARRLPGTGSPSASVPPPAIYSVCPSKALGEMLPLPLVGSVRGACARR